MATKMGPSNPAGLEGNNEKDLPTRPTPRPDSSKQRYTAKRRDSSHRGGRIPRQKRPRQTHTNLGYFGNVPSLPDLYKANRKQASKHAQHKLYSRQGSRANHLTAVAPPSAPGPAQFPGADANPKETPTLAGTVPGGVSNAADKLQDEGLQENLDFYATNAGLVFYDNTPLVSSSDGEMDSPSLSGAVSDSAEGDEGGKMPRDASKLQLQPQASLDNIGNSWDGLDLRSKIIRRLRTRISEQDAYIAQLEDDNLCLQERLDLARQQLKEVRRTY